MAHSASYLDDAVVQHFISDLLPRLRAQWAAEHVILYGSRARGEPDQWSDLDVVVVSPRFQSIRFIDRWPQLFRALGSPVELEPLCYTPEEFERACREPGVVHTACEEGIWLL